MISTTDRASIHFFLDGEKYAYRGWPYVPRVGDEIMLHVPAEGGKRAFVVKRVVWGVEGPQDDDLGMQAVNIEIARTE